MSQETQKNTPNPNVPNNLNDPIIPSGILLTVAALAIVLAVGDAFVNGRLGFISFGGIIVAVISLVFWGATNPTDVKNIASGRFFLFGGTAFVVAIMLGTVLTLAYIGIRSQGWSNDLSLNNNFSLDDTGREIVSLLGQDPTTPNLLITAFFDAASASQADQSRILLDEISTLSNDKITYEVINLDREPVLAERLQVQSGQAVISTAATSNEIDPENFQLVPAIVQQALLEQIVTASAVGDYRAFYLNTNGTIQIDDSSESGAQVFDTQLRERYRWQTQAITIQDLQTGRVNLNAGADGNVLVIMGGSEPLPDESLQLIIDYVNAGGDLVIFSNPNVRGGESLTTADNLNNYLETSFGIRITRDFVVDPTATIGQGNAPIALISTNFGTTSITAGYDPTADALAFSYPARIAISPTLPANVTVSPIASTSDQAYAKVDLDYTSQSLTFDPQDTDLNGVQVLAAISENSVTGARVAVFGAIDFPLNTGVQLLSIGLRNFEAASRALFWASGYESQATTLAQLPPATTPQQTPIFGTENQVSMNTFVAVILLPFGVLAIGVLVWLSRRERATF
jgi:hypothetical protein